MLYRPIRTPEDYNQLQLDMNKLCTWTDNNLLTYNTNKCKYMVISRKKQPSLPSMPLNVNNSPMEMVSSYKYLGVWLTSSLDWSKQVTSVCKKARQHVASCTGSSMAIQTLSLYKNCICRTFARIWSMQPQSGTHTSMGTLTHLKRYKSLH